MREINYAQSKSKLRLLDAAEQLFAERGFEAVSVRDVTRLAKANVAAVNYHFGSREGMVGLVISRYVAPVNEERLARLDVLECKWSGKVVPLEEILDAFVRPVVGQMLESGLSERLLCKLLGRIFARQGDELPSVVREQTETLVDRFMKAFGKALPGVPQEELVWRVHFVVGALIHTLLSQEMPDRLSGGISATDVTMGRLVRFAAAGLREGVALDPEAKKGPQATFDF